MSDKENNSVGLALPFQQMLIDEMVESILVIDTDYRVILANKTALDHLPKGLKPSDQLYCYQVTHQRNEPCSGEEHVCPLSRVIKLKKSYTVTHHHFTGEGGKYPVEISASPIVNQNGEVTAVIEVARDISERVLFEEEQKKLQTKLYEQQKEDSLSRLAVGLAHDFNNRLTTMIGNAELIKVESLNNPKIFNLAEAVIKSGSHMADLIDKLLAYVKKGEYQPQYFVVNSVIQDAVALVHKGKLLETRIEYDLKEDLETVFGDPDHIRQVIIDVISNSLEAMTGNEGCLTIKTSRQHKKNVWECDLHCTHPSGDYICIDISDTGSGIPREMQGKIFEPFFTTKFLGRGLGLAAAKGIIQDHGGGIRVESSYGEGATFHIYLPCETSGRSRVEDTKSGEKIGWGRVLVVDDDPMVLKVLNKMLTQHGYEVEAADNGRQAMKILLEENNGISLVILDIQMGGLSGSQVYKMVKNKKLNVRVLIASGYDKKTILNEITLMPEDDFIQKPFTFSGLISKVNRLMVTDKSR